MDQETAQNLVDTIRTASEPHFLEIIAWLGAIVLTAVAVYAVVFTREQLLEMRRNNEASALHTRATFLLELDGRWDSTEMQAARRLLHKLREDIIKLVAAKHPRLDERHTVEKISMEFRKVLSEMREQDHENYANIMRFCGFFETVGLMVRKEYVDIDDIHSLLKGPILDIENYFKLHIADLQNETGVPEGLLENALNLVVRVKQHDS